MTWLNVSLGRWLGIPVYLHWSWMLLFFYIAVVNPLNIVPYCILFFIVLLHELGHCMAGRYYNMAIRDVMLYPFGGVAMMEIPRKPSHEIVVALAGPFVNLALVLPLYFLQRFGYIMWEIYLANIILLVFNILPVFPMDGGRVLRACLSWWNGNHLKATHIAVLISRVFCGLFVITALLTRQWSLIFIAFFVVVAGAMELAMLRALHGKDEQSFAVDGYKRAEEVQGQLNRLRRRENLPD